jgi:hypothetical protein
LLKAIQVTASLDAALQKTYLPTVSLDALLQPHLRTVSFNAILLGGTTRTVSLDGSIQRQGIETTCSLDAALQKTYLPTASLDAALQKTYLPTVSLDAILQPHLRTVLLDAVLSGGTTKTVLLDAALQKTYLPTVSLTGQIQRQGIEATCSLDAVLTSAAATVTITASLDSVLIRPDVRVRVKRFAADTSGGTQDITIPNFGTPKAVMFIGTTETSDGISTGTGGYVSLGIGFTDGTNNRLGVGHILDGAATSSDMIRLDTSECCGVRAPSDAAENFASFSTWITDGVRISWTTAPEAAYLIDVVFFGGDDLQAAVGDVNSNLTLSGLSFAPELALLYQPHGRFNTKDTDSSNIRGGFGISYNNGVSTDEACVSWHYYSGNSPAISDARIQNNGAIGDNSLSGTYNGVTSWNSDGFALGSSGTIIFDTIYLALDLGGVGANLSVVDTATSGGDDATTGLGWQPQWLLAWTSDHDTVNQKEQDGTGVAQSIGVADEFGAYVACFSEEDGVSTTNSWHGSDDKLILAYDDSGGTLINDATLTSFDADGYTINYATANATARKMMVLAIQQGQSFSPGVSCSLDAVLIANKVQNVDLTAQLQKTYTVTASLDALIVGTVLNVSFDAVLQKTITTTCSLDAELIRVFVPSVSFDGILQTVLFGVTIGMDGKLQSPNILRTASLDAVLIKGTTKTTSFDAELIRLADLTVSMDAILLLSGKELSFSMSAVMYDDWRHRTDAPASIWVPSGIE